MKIIFKFEKRRQYQSILLCKMATVEQPMFMLPKKRNGKKQSSIVGHVDHIITVQVCILKSALLKKNYIE